MSSFLLQHHHAPEDCAAAFAAWSGYDSPLRHRPAVSTCLAGGHTVLWRVTADDVSAALALLPPFVRRTTVAARVRDVDIP